MRVIAGKYRGRRLVSPADNRVRPTTDRLKETIFNILVSRGAVADAAVLDLFAGTGALGLEALSRGAKNAVFVDCAESSLQLVRTNLHGVTQPYEIYHADYKLALQKLRGRSFDLILLDPPYADLVEQDVLARIAENNLLRTGGTIFIEHSTKNNLINPPKGFIIDTRQCGNTSLSFLEYEVQP